MSVGFPLMASFSAPSFSKSEFFLSETSFISIWSPARLRSVRKPLSSRYIPARPSTLPARAQVRERGRKTSIFLVYHSPSPVISLFFRWLLLLSPVRDMARDLQRGLLFFASVIIFLFLFFFPSPPVCFLN